MTAARGVLGSPAVQSFATEMPGQTTRVTFLADLRDATALRHVRLDRGVVASAFSSPARYAAFLCASLAAIEPIEAAVARLDARFVAERAARIRADLAVLGVARAPSTSIASIASVPRAFGAEYVIEGSALGGLVIAQRVIASGIDARATSYLTFRGSSTKGHWVELVARLEGWAATSTAAERADACDEACRTFDAYIAAFEREGLLVA